MGQRGLHGTSIPSTWVSVDSLSMSTDPNNPVVDWSSLCWIVEYFHDRSGVLCLGDHDVEISARQPRGSLRSRGEVFGAWVGGWRKAS